MKTQLLTQALDERQTPLGKGKALGEAIIYHGDARYVNQELDELQAVTAADVQRVLRKYVLDAQAGDDRVRAGRRPRKEARQMNDSLRRSRWSPRSPRACVAAQPYDTPPPAGAPRPRGHCRAGRADARQRPARRRRAAARPAARHRGARDPLGRRSRSRGACRDSPTSRRRSSPRAPRKRTAPQIAEAAEALGGQLDSGAGWYRSFVAMTVTRPQLAAALDADRRSRAARRASPPPSSSARAGWRIDGLSVALRDPGTLARMAADRAAFGAGAYGHPAHGTPASLARMRRADVVAQHARFYRPDNAALIFAGDIDPKDARRARAGGVRRWARPARRMPASGRDAAQPVARCAARDRDDRAPGRRAWRWRARRSRDRRPTTTPGVVANTLLGGGYSSRLNQEIRIKRGLSYGVQSRLDARRAGGVWSIGGADQERIGAGSWWPSMLDEIRRVGERRRRPRTSSRRASSR